MNNNYSEQIFQSIDKIISQRLNEVYFDKTEICTVISKDPDHTGKYAVTNEAGLKYDAYTTNENISYFEGQKIYVTVPQGDYSLRKIIIGSYCGDDIPKDLYVNPFDDLIVSSEYNWINETNKLEAIAYKDKTIDQNPYLSNEITFYYSGLGQFNYIGLDFAATTDFGGTSGEFQIVIDLLDKNKQSLLTPEQLGLITYSSKQLYGNPYYLNKTLRFQHLFNFPIGNFSDLTKVKHIRITLITKGDFNYEGEETKSVVLEDLILYFGFKSSENNMSKNKIVLDLDEPDGTKESSKDYTHSSDVKKMSIDWVMTDTTAVYNETIHRQYPEAKKYNIYWLQYSESIGYKKMLESVKPDILDCYPKDKTVTKEEYSTALKEKFKNNFGESIDVYDKALYDKYVSFYQDSYAKFKAKIETTFIDISESGTYWKTVKKTDAYNASAYTYSLQPAPTWKNEQIKVIIKSIDSNDYLTSESITFTNTEFRQAVGSSQGKGDTLKLTLATGDDGIYNSYGIDNKLLTTEVATHKLTVSYIDENLEKLWENSLQKVIWKIPKHASMVTIPKIRQEQSDGSFKFAEDSRWNKTADPNFYIYTNSSNDEAKTIEFNISEQFGHNKTNNTIYCEIVRYKSATLDYPEDTYEGSIKLQFGTQGTSGSAYAFNIYPNTSDGLLKDGSNSIKFAAKLEDNKGQNIPFNANNVQWYFLYGGEEIKHENIPTGDVYTIDKNFINFIESKGKNSYYCILVAELTSWTDATGNNINLKAYYPIPRTSMTGYYMSGASRIVYNYQGSSPNYDQSAYTLYDKYHHKVPVARWEIRFPGWKDEKYWSEGKKRGYWDNFPSLKKIDENSSELRLQPLPNIQTNVLACNITAYKDNSNETSSILWAQPLLIIRNSYAFDILNAWDGNLLIDHEDNKILSQLIGAGTKNEKNQFTGVLMGAVGKYGAASTGLYGFQNGDLRYKLDEHGNFYVGTGDDNKIDFTNGTLNIQAKNFKLQIEDGKNENQLYFSNIARPYGTDGKSAWLQFKDKVYLNSDGTATIGGWNINANSFSHNSNKYYLGQGLSNQKVGDHSNLTLAFKAGNKFGVATDGTLYAKDGYFSGQINATKLTLSGDASSDFTTLTENTIKTTTVTAQNLVVTAAKISGQLKATQIDVTNVIKAGSADIEGIVKATEISASKITAGTTSATITMSGNVTISGNLTVNGTGTIAGCKINSSGNLVVNSGNISSLDVAKIKIGNEKIKFETYTVSSTNDSFRIYANGDVRDPYFCVTPDSIGIYGSNAQNQTSTINVGKIIGGYDFRISSFNGLISGTWYRDGEGSLTSDKNKKNSIEILDNRYEILFDNLTPRRFKFNNGTSGRFHTGFISQEVGEALFSANLDTKEFSGYVVKYNKDNTEDYYLRYENFISLNTWQIQKLKARVTELENEIKEIKQNEN